MPLFLIIQGSLSLSLSPSLFFFFKGQRTKTQGTIRFWIDFKLLTEFISLRIASSSVTFSPILLTGVCLSAFTAVPTAISYLTYLFVYTFF